MCENDVDDDDDVFENNDDDDDDGGYNRLQGTKVGGIRPATRSYRHSAS